MNVLLSQEAAPDLDEEIWPMDLCPASALQNTGFFNSTLARDQNIAAVPFPQRKQVLHGPACPWGKLLIHRIGAARGFSGILPSKPPETGRWGIDGK